MIRQDARRARHGLPPGSPYGDVARAAKAYAARMRGSPAGCPMFPGIGEPGGAAETLCRMQGYIDGRLEAAGLAPTGDEMLAMRNDVMRDAAVREIVVGMRDSGSPRSDYPLSRLHLPRKGRPHFGAARARRIGTATRFADCLRGRGILREDDKLDEFFVAHRMQKYAYIASMLGVRLRYKFYFLESGAHSGDLALDLHSHTEGRGGDDPFGKSPAALDNLVDIVHDRRDTRWLQMATFAIRDLSMGETRDEFVERMLDRRLGYTRRAAVDAFERVHSHRQDLMSSSQ